MIIAAKMHHDRSSTDKKQLPEYVLFSWHYLQLDVEVTPQVLLKQGLLSDYSDHLD